MNFTDMIQLCHYCVGRHEYKFNFIIRFLEIVPKKSSVVSL